MYTFPGNGYYGGFDFDFGGTPEFGSVEVAGVFNAVMIGFFIGLIIGFAIAAALYIFRAVGLYRIASRRGIPNPIMAWVPILNSYLIGKIADDIELSMNRKTSNRIRLVALDAARFVLGFIMWIVMAFSLTDFVTTMMRTGGNIGDEAAFRLLVPFFVSYLVFGFLLFLRYVLYTVFYYVALYKIYKEYSPNNAAAFTILGIFFNFLIPFFVFSIRNNKSGYEIWNEQQQAFAAARAAQTPVTYAEPAAPEAPAEPEAPVEPEVPAEPVDEVPAEQDTPSDPE